jgi:hypothetical protein
MPSPSRPPRQELFALYYLGFEPSGNYHFPNVHHVSRYYNASVTLIQSWLEELDLTPAEILRKDCGLAGLQVDLQMEAPDLTPEEIRERISEILDEVDTARPTRRPWEDD